MATISYVNVSSYCLEGMSLVDVDISATMEKFLTTHRAALLTSKQVVPKNDYLSGGARHLVVVPKIDSFKNEITRNQWLAFIEKDADAVRVYNMLIEEYDDIIYFFETYESVVSEDHVIVYDSPRK